MKANHSENANQASGFVADSDVADDSTDNSNIADADVANDSTDDSNIADSDAATLIADGANKTGGLIEYAEMFGFIALTLVLLVFTFKWAKN